MGCLFKLWGKKPRVQIESISRPFETQENRRTNLGHFTPMSPNHELYSRPGTRVGGKTDLAEGHKIRDMAHSQLSPGSPMSTEAVLGHHDIQVAAHANDAARLEAIDRWAAPAQARKLLHR